MDFYVIPNDNKLAVVGPFPDERTATTWAQEHLRGGLALPLPGGPLPMHGPVSPNGWTPQTGQLSAVQSVPGESADNNPYLKFEETVRTELPALGFEIDDAGLIRPKE